MAAIISGGDGPTPSLPSITPAKPGSAKALGNALAGARKTAVKMAVGGYQPTSSSIRIVSGGG